MPTARTPRATCPVHNTVFSEKVAAQNGWKCPIKGCDQWVTFVTIIEYHTNSFMETRSPASANGPRSQTSDTSSDTVASNITVMFPKRGQSVADGAAQSVEMNSPESS